MPSIRGLCPECHRPLSLADVAAQAKLRCPHCSSVFAAALLKDPQTAAKSDSQAERPASGGAGAKSGPRPTGAPSGSSAKKPRSASTGAASGKIGRYEVREKLGRGAFGTVYRAFDP